MSTNPNAVCGSLPPIRVSKIQNAQKFIEALRNTTEEEARHVTNHTAKLMGSTSMASFLKNFRLFVGSMMQHIEAASRYVGASEIFNIAPCRQLRVDKPIKNKAGVAIVPGAKLCMPDRYFQTPLPYKIGEQFYFGAGLIFVKTLPAERRITHIVGRHRSLVRIAFDHGVSYPDLLKWNGLEPKIQPGQKLDIYDHTYVVRSGETLLDITRRYMWENRMRWSYKDLSMTYLDLLRLNRLQPRIQEGQKLTIFIKSPPASAPIMRVESALPIDLLQPCK